MIENFKVYYNKNAFMDTPPEYEFLTTGTVDSYTGEVKTALGYIFDFFNGVEVAEIQLTSDLFDIPRSMSVSDVVIIGENAWRCDSVGWSDFDVSQLPQESMQNNV